MFNKFFLQFFFLFSIVSSEKNKSLVRAHNMAMDLVLGAPELIIAINLDDDNKVKGLLSSKQNIKEFLDNEDYNGNKLLALALKQSSQKVASLLISLGADTKNVNREVAFETALNLAVEYDNEKVVKLLLRDNTNVNWRNFFGFTPLHIAVMNNNKNLIKILLDNGADIEIKDEFSFTPLDMAINKNAFELVKLLTSKVDNFNQQVSSDCNYLYSALHRAVDKKDERIISYLLDKGLGLEARDKNGRTPIFTALASRNVQMINFLLKKGANIDATEEDGLTPLHVCSLAGEVDLVRFLISKGADVNIPVANKSLTSFIKEMLQDSEQYEQQELESLNGVLIELEKAK